ncbi:MAG: HEAT repeat domain-containing protein [Planctomycetaceae bacterium]
MAHRRLTDGMRRVALSLCLAAALLVPGCKSGKKPVTTSVERISVKLPPEVAERESTKIVRRVNRNIDLWQELLLQGKPSQAHGLRLSIAREVDENFPVFESVAREGEFTQLRNLAVKGVAFASAKRADARALLDHLLGDPQITILQNAALGHGILGDPDTDLSKLIALAGHGDVEVRTNAASSLGKLFRLKEIPRELSQEYRIAIDRLGGLMLEQTSVRARRAAVVALANLHHPETLPLLVNSLEDEDVQVQISGLFGLKELADQRALDPVLQYLRGNPSEAGASWAAEVLVRIALEGGFTQDASELEALGTNPGAWKSWFDTARMR